jgi:hypothetical protein
MSYTKLHHGDLLLYVTVIFLVITKTLANKPQKYYLERNITPDLRGRLRERNRTHLMQICRGRGYRRRHGHRADLGRGPGEPLRDGGGAHIGEAAVGMGGARRRLAWEDRMGQAWD